MERLVIQDNHGSAPEDSLAIAIGDTITVAFSGVGNIALPTMTLLARDAVGVTAAYQVGEGEGGGGGPVHVYLIPWPSIRFISKVVEEE